MTVPTTEVWQEILAALKDQISPDDIKIWLDPETVWPARCSSDELVLSVPNGYYRNWISSHCVSAAEQILAKKFERPMRLSLEMRAPTDSPEVSTAAPAGPRPPARSAFDSRYTFDTFVVGKSNRFAQAAALAVANKPGQVYNPLFIWAGSGLGKTHVLHAIGNKLSAQGQGAVYVSSERFMNEFIDAIRTGRQEEFRAKYRSADCLLIDDIHFLVGKQSSQEEFFNTFNALYEKRKQIVLTSDTPPRDLGVDERLRSRLNWGLTADIKQPDFETRLAILRSKADCEEMEVPEEVLRLIAEVVRTNVRELEGALTKLVAHAAVDHLPLTVDGAREILRAFSEPEENFEPPTLDRVLAEVAEFYHLDVRDLKSTRKSSEVSHARHVGMYLAKKLLGLTFEEIGKAFGGRDHSTVLHAFHKIAAKAEDDLYLSQAIHTIDSRLRRPRKVENP